MTFIELNNGHLSWPYIRTALSLSLFKKKRVRIIGAEDFIRESRDLLPLYEDLKKCIDEFSLGSLYFSERDLLFDPGELSPGKLSIETSMFSSGIEIELFLLPSLFYADYRSVLEIRGVTHSNLSLPTSFVKETLLNVLEMTGHYASLNLRRFGFYGSGGGFFESRVYPHENTLSSGSLDIVKKEIAGVKIFISGLTSEIAKRQKAILCQGLGLVDNKVVIMEVLDSDGYGNSIQIFVDTETENKIIPVVFSFEAKVYNSAGDFVFDESDVKAEIEILIKECLSYLKSKNWPDSVLFEALPFLRLAGHDFGASECSEKLLPLSQAMDRLGL